MAELGRGRLVDGVIDVHLKGSFHVSRPAFAAMKEQGYGRFIHTPAAAGLFGNFGQANYGAAKMGLVGLINVLRQEGAKYNIRVNALAPTAGTRMTEGIIAEGIAREHVERAVRLVDLNEYKRSQAPTGIRVTTKAFGMGRRMPIAARYGS